MYKGPNTPGNADRPAPADITVLVCTFNRSGDLRELLETALAQITDGSFTYEVLVVDNNSTDDTRTVVEAFLTRSQENLRYLFEGTQGKSYALNTGVAAARGAIVTIADDDFILPPDWVQKIVTAFRADRERSFVSGKVLPLWLGNVPPWLGPELWSAVGLIDYGDRQLTIDSGNPLCLIGCSFRRADIEAVGGYRADLGVSKNLIGSVEDLEILQRLWKSERWGVYLPDIVCHHKVQTSRLTKAYLRRWHAGHGRFYALLRDEGLERSTARLFDVPAHLYAQGGRGRPRLVQIAPVTSAQGLRAGNAAAFFCRVLSRAAPAASRQRRWWHPSRARHLRARAAGASSRLRISSRVDWIAVPIPCAFIISSTRV